MAFDLEVAVGGDDVEVGLRSEHLLEPIIEFLAELWVDGRGEVGELGDGDGFGFDWDGGTGEGVAASAAGKE